MQNETNLVPLEMHNRLTAGPAPWTATRLPSELWHVARAVYGTSNEDDEKRCYRTVQAALWKLAATPAAAPAREQQAGESLRYAEGYGRGHDAGWASAMAHVAAKAATPAPAPLTESALCREVCEYGPQSEDEETGFRDGFRAAERVHGIKEQP